MNNRIFLETWFFKITNNVYNIKYILQKTRPKFETTSFSEDMNLLSKPEHFIICDRLLETEHVLNIQNKFIKYVFQRKHYSESVNILLKQ